MKFKIGIFISLVGSLVVIDLLYSVTKPKKMANNNFTMTNTPVGFYSLIQSNWPLDHVAVSKMDRRKHASNNGYILSSAYSDQMTAAIRHVVGLQCWAATVSHQLRVVEPFLHEGSKLGFAVATPNNDKDENLLTLSDILNIEKLEEFVREKNYSPLSTWNSFLEDAPRDLILVCSCTNPKRVSCEDQNKTFYQDAMTFAEDNDFQVVRYVYLVKYPYIYKATEFRKLVYGQFSPNTSVVLFNQWGGVVNSATVPRYRLGMSDMNYCSSGKFSQTTRTLLQSSELIHQDAQRYMKQYLHKKYVSVMFRTEYFALNHGLRKLSSTKQMLLLTKCVNSIIDLVENMKKKYGIESVFLAMDCRKQGSFGYREKLRDETEASVTDVASLLYRKLYGNSSSLEDWDDSFDNISSYKVPGYIAQLQKELAASGTCLLTAGGGSFHRSAKALHHRMHNSSTQCIHDVPNC